MPSTVAPGSLIDRYRIIEAIGKGGMGEVYKAWDATLERQVALKILPPEMVRSDDRVRRFVQEAKSASSLNHPHIVTIHDIGEARLSAEGNESSVRYIAMELVDGETLREKIHGSRTDLRTVVAWLAQAADGLAKAHSAGIVHRDLKPDNVMITRDGYAKVLDFGLAKLVERSATVGQDDPTVVPDATREGFIVGTIGYMSPEQIEARPVDARSDVFSFGCIVYEAATRRKPFRGASEVDVMHRIVHGQPEPIDDTTIPADLRRVVRRCLAKSPEERIQSMKDLAIELREIAANWDELPTASDASHAKTIIVASPRKRRWPMFAGIALLIAVIAAAAFFAVRALRKPHFTLETLKIDKLTSSGNVIDFALTPDGRYLVQETDDGGQFSVWLKQTATGSNVRIVPPSPVRMQGVSVSPDGNYVYYAHTDDPTSRYASLYRVTALGGDPVKINSDTEGAPGFSADGQRIAFLRMNQKVREFRIFTANTDGSGERVIAKQTAPDVRPVRPSWSPDGKSIAFVTMGGGRFNIVLYDTSTGAGTNLGQPWRSITGIAWLPDGSGIIASGSPLDGSQSRIAFVSYPSGEQTTIRTDTDAYTGVSITGDGKTIAAGQQIRFSSLATGDINGQNLKTITTPDLVVLRIANGCNIPIFIADDGSGAGLWVADASGSPQKLTAVKTAYQVWASRDGQSIVFLSSIAGKPHLYFTRPDGSGLRQLTNGDGERGAAVSPDGQWLLYFSGGKIFRQPMNGGLATLFAERALGGAAYSLDGRWVAVTQWDDDAEHHLQGREFIYPAAGGKPVADNPVFAENRLYRWGPVPDSFVYFDDVANANVFLLDQLRNTEPKQLTHFPSGRIFDIGFSNDGKRMYIARGERRSDVVRITDFR